MNERIKELAEQSELNLELQSIKVEKFAKLIINECLAICEELGDKGLDGHYCADKIVRHFRDE